MPGEGRAKRDEEVHHQKLSKSTGRFLGKMGGTTERVGDREKHGGRGRRS